MNAPILRTALLFGTSLRGSRTWSERFLFFGDKACGRELGGYATGEDMSGMVYAGGDEGKE
jgi:hypothetical protein